MSPVTSINYELRWASDNFKVTPDRMELTLGDFDCVVEGLSLTAVPRTRIADPQEAVALLEPELAAWALELELERGWRLEFRLAGTRAEDPPDGGPRVIRVGLNEYVGVSDSASVQVQTDLPAPRKRYTKTPLVADFLARLRDVDAGREKVSAAAYYLITHVEARFQSRADAATSLNMSRQLLDEVAKLASRGGNPVQSRKAQRRPGEPALDDADLAWLRQAMSAIVRRVAEVEAGQPALPRITQADVPRT